MNARRLLALATLCAAALAGLAACGSGGGSESTGSALPPPAAIDPNMTAPVPSGLTTATASVAPNHFAQSSIQEPHRTSKDID
jgi:hypothetical protein